MSRERENALRGIDEFLAQNVDENLTIVKLWDSFNITLFQNVRFCN